MANECKNIPGKEPQKYDKYTKYIKDVIYIVGILASLYGWINSKAKNEATMNTTIKNNTEVLNKLELFMNKQIDINTKQAGLDGQYSEYIRSTKK